VGALTAEHARGRALVQELANATDANQERNSGRNGATISALRGIAALYPNHIWKENYLILPMTNKVLSLDEQHLLYSEFDKVDERIGLNHYRRLEELAEHFEVITLTVKGEIEPKAFGPSPS
jgi:hemerythrin-like domain-containing protein